jgi:hypothetical protein
VGQCRKEAVDEKRDRQDETDLEKNVSSNLKFRIKGYPFNGIAAFQINNTN